MSQAAVSIRELNQQTGPTPAPFAVDAQLEALLKKTARSGNPYCELRFVDAEEKLVLRAWDDTPAFQQADSLAVQGFFRIDGQFYQNDRGYLEAKDWNLRPLNQEEIDALLHGSDELRTRQDGDFAFIETTIGGLADPRLRSLGQAFLQQFGERMKRTGAARRNHHARRGGLVEHVAQMMRSAVQICVAYPDLNRDLLVTGVLFHDIGKLWENAYAAKGFTMPYTEASELISHIPVGMEIVNRLWRELMDSEESAGWLALEPASDQVRLHLLHLIASHHGELAFGSPVPPKTPEAFALHYIDNLDAKLQMVAEAYDKASELGNNVYEKQWPLPGNLVRPLPRFEGLEAVAPPGVAPEHAETPVSEPESESESESADDLPIPEPSEEELGEEEPF